MNNYITDYHDINDINFEIANCPAYETGDCRAHNYKVTCKDCKECIIKSHVIHLAALVSVASRRPGSAEQVGALCCLNTFLIKKGKNNETKIK